MIFLFIGAASKEFAFMLPFIFILYDYSFELGFSLKKGIKRYAAAFLVIFIFLVVKSILIPLGSSFVFESETLYKRAITTLPIMFGYIRSQIVPYNLSIYFGIPFKETFFDISVLASFLFFAALVTLFVWYRKKYKILFFSFFTYLFLLFARLIFLAFNKKKGLIPIVTIAFAVFLSVFTIQRNHVFKSNFLLFFDSVKKNPTAIILRNNLGNEYRKRGDYNKAEKQFLLAVKCNPEFYLSYNNLAVLYSAKNENEKALENLKESYRLNPKFPLTVYNLALINNYFGNIDESNRFYNEAISLNPELYSAYFNLASNYYRQGKYEMALENLQRIVDSSPDENDKKEARRRIRIISDKIKARSSK
jgi:tetratricopeptide (TPR) repeat protein